MNLTRIEQLLKFLEEDRTMSFRFMPLRWSTGMTCRQSNGTARQTPGLWRLSGLYRATISTKNQVILKRLKNCLRKRSVFGQLKDNATQRELQAAYELLDD